MEKNTHHFIPMTSVASGKGIQVGDDIYCYTNQIVNIVMVGSANHWILIDTGMPKCGEEIEQAAYEHLGEHSVPKAIILTHGHFDHVGGAVHLAAKWQVPVYAHALEFPFLTGERPYPRPDPSVQGGMLAKISFLYPTSPLDLRPLLQPLPNDGTVPFLPDWKWVHTPGHSPGHVSFFRSKDRMLLSGDALITVRQDSLYRVLIQEKEVNGPPVYLTTDWVAAEQSVQRLQALSPQVLVPGHGSPMEGQELKAGIDELVQDFKKVAVPRHGKYVDNKEP